MDGSLEEASLKTNRVAVFPRFLVLYAIPPSPHLSKTCYFKPNNEGIALSSGEDILWLSVIG